MAEELSHFLATVALVAGYCLSAFAALWLAILLHELAHAGVCRAVGDTVLAGQVGSGGPVLPMRLFGVPWELRLLPRNGLVRLLHRPGAWYRSRVIAVLLAGPLASTACAALLFVWWGSRPHDVRFDWWTMPMEGGLQAATTVTIFMGVAVWVPITSSVGGQVVASDTLNVLRVLLAGRPDPTVLAATYEQRLAEHRAWQSFLAGDHAAALAGIRGLPCEPGFEFLRDAAEAFYLWPVAGAAAALQLLDRAEAAYDAWLEQSAGATDIDPRTRRKLRRQLEGNFLINRAFFAVVAGTPESLAEADASSADAMQLLPRNLAATRTRGLVELHLGEVDRGMARLHHAWRHSEPVWLRSLCALYLAYGHALRGEAGKARRRLQTARWLHPHNPLLADYEARIAVALQASAN